MVKFKDVVSPLSETSGSACTGQTPVSMYRFTSGEQRWTRLNPFWYEGDSPFLKKNILWLPSGHTCTFIFWVDHVDLLTFLWIHLVDVSTLQLDLKFVGSKEQTCSSDLDLIRVLKCQTFVDSWNQFSTDADILRKILTTDLSEPELNFIFRQQKLPDISQWKQWPTLLAAPKWTPHHPSLLDYNVTYATNFFWVIIFFGSVNIPYVLNLGMRGGL